MSEAEQDASASSAVDVEHESVCRICFEADGALLAPCACQGSVQHVHFDCLKTWAMQCLSIQVQQGLSQAAWDRCGVCTQRYTSETLMQVNLSLTWTILEFFGVGCFWPNQHFLSWKQAKEFLQHSAEPSRLTLTFLEGVLIQLAWHTLELVQQLSYKSNDEDYNHSAYMRQCSFFELQQAATKCMQQLRQARAQLLLQARDIRQHMGALSSEAMSIFTESQAHRSVLSVAPHDVSLLDEAEKIATLFGTVPADALHDLCQAIRRAAQQHTIAQPSSADNNTPKASGTATQQHAGISADTSCVAVKAEGTAAPIARQQNASTVTHSDVADVDVDSVASTIVELAEQHKGTPEQTTPHMPEAVGLTTNQDAVKPPLNPKASMPEAASSGAQLHAGISADTACSTLTSADTACSTLTPAGISTRTHASQPAHAPSSMLTATGMATQQLAGSCTQIGTSVQEATSGDVKPSDTVASAEETVCSAAQLPTGHPARTPSSIKGATSTCVQTLEGSADHVHAILPQAISRLDEHDISNSVDIQAYLCKPTCMAVQKPTSSISHTDAPVTEASCSDAQQLASTSSMHSTSPNTPDTTSILNTQRHGGQAAPTIASALDTSCATVQKHPSCCNDAPQVASSHAVCSDANSHARVLTHANAGLREAMSRAVQQFGDAAVEKLQQLHKHCQEFAAITNSIECVMPQAHILEQQSESVFLQVKPVVDNASEIVKQAMKAYESAELDLDDAQPGTAVAEAALDLMRAALVACQDLKTAAQKVNDIAQQKQRLAEVVQDLKVQVKQCALLIKDLSQGWLSTSRQ